MCTPIKSSPATSDNDGPPLTAAATEPSTSRDDSGSGRAGNTTRDYYDDLFDEDEDEDDEDAFNCVINNYMSKRNISNDICDPKYTSKTIIEYVNLKYIESNFRTMGLNNTFDINNVTEAQAEFESFEKWFIRKKKYVPGKKYIKDLRLPMFSHLYLSLYTEDNRDRLLAFLDAFKYLFVNSQGAVFLEELKNLTDINNLSPCLSLFRKNKYVFSVSPEFLNNLYEFFQHHRILKAVFQEWFDINYSTNEDPMTIFKKYYSKHESNNQVRTHAVKLSNTELKNGSSASNNNLIGKFSNSSENKNSQCIIDSQNNISNNGEGKQKLQKELNKLNGENKSSSYLSESSSEGTSEDSHSKLSFSDEEIPKRKYIRHKEKSGKPLSYKTSWHTKVSYTTKIEAKNLDEDTYLNNTRQIALIDCKKLSCTILTSDQKYVAGGSLDSLIYLWERTKFDVNTCLNLPSDQSNDLIEYYDSSSAIILRGHGGSVFDLAEISSAKILLSASNDKTFRAWDLESKLCIEVYNEYEHRTWCIAACPNTLQVATGSCDGTSCLWFLNYKRPLRVFVGHLDDILVIKFHPNQVVLATGSADKTIRVFELVTGECQRLLLGHTDYISCLEFHAEKPNILASACGAGEVILWDLPSSTILWKLQVTKVLFSDLAWLTSDILLASINTGMILKCDTTKNYVNTIEKIEGFTTKLNRMMSLKIIDNTVYTIGISGKDIPNASIKKRQTKVTKRVKSDSQVSQQQHESTPLLLQPNVESNSNSVKLLQPNVESNSNSVKLLLGSNSSKENLTSDLQYQLNINPNTTTQALQEFLQLNLKSSAFNLTSDETTKLSSEYQSNNIRLIQKASKNPTTTLQSNAQMTTDLSTLQINVESQNVQPININVSQPSNNVATKVIQQQPFLNNRVGNNSVVQKLQPVIRPRLTTTQLMQKSVPQQEQHQQLLVSNVGSNIHIAGANVLQHPKFQQIRPTSLLAPKMNVQQRQQQQTNLMANVSVTQSFGEHVSTKTNAQLVDSNIQHMSKPGSSLPSTSACIRSTVRPQKPTLATKLSSLEKMPPEDYARLRQAVMASLLQTNPEMFTRGQTVIGEITRSQSLNIPESKPKSPQNENV